MKTKQYSAKILEVVLDNEVDFISFFDKSYVYFQNHFIIINGKESDIITEYMHSKNLTFTFNLILPKQTKRKSREVEKRVEQNVQKPTEKLKVKSNLKVLDKLVRSGQEINIDGDLLLLNRVNSGGSIVVNGTLIITQIVDGSIRCDGDFMMMQASSKANILFHGVEVDNKFLQDRLNRVELIDNEIVITSALKEKSWV